LEGWQYVRVWFWAITVELELPTTVKIHPVVNMGRLQLYKPQVEGQKAMPPALVIVEGEEEYEVERSLIGEKYSGRTSS